MLRLLVVLMAVTVMNLTSHLHAVSTVKMIVNEFNSVGPDKYIEGYVYSDLHNGRLVHDEYVRTYPGMPSDIENPLLNDGRIQGNLGDWIELIVLEDHLDIRSWKLRWAETLKYDTTGVDIWYRNGNIEQGIIMFSDAPIWSDLRAGTIITIAEKHDVEVDTEWDDSIPPNRNFTYGVPDEEAEVIISLRSDLTYDPEDGDWWIHIGTRDEIEQLFPLVTTVTNVSGDAPGDFSVGNDNWQCTILDAEDNIIFGPVGEACPNWGGSGINSREIGKLETNPIPGQTNVWYLSNFNDGSSSTFSLPNLWDTSTNPKAQSFAQLRNWALKITSISFQDENVLIEWNDDVITGSVRNGEVPEYINLYARTSYTLEWSEDMITWHAIPVGSVSSWEDNTVSGYEVKFYRIRISD